MADKVTDIRGIDPTIAQKMHAAGIRSTTDLLAKTTTPAARTALAKELSMAGSDLTELVNRADLMRLSGVGKEMAHLLEECGVDSVKELRRRKPDNLCAALAAANAEQKLTHHAPSLAQVTAWIAEAAQLTTASDTPGN